MAVVTYCSHVKILKPLGNGWSVSCACGWGAGIPRNWHTGFYLTSAELMFRAHLTNPSLIWDPDAA